MSAFPWAMMEPSLLVLTRELGKAPEMCWWNSWPQWSFSLSQKLKADGDSENQTLRDEFICIRCVQKKGLLEQLT